MNEQEMRKAVEKMVSEIMSQNTTQEEVTEIKKSEGEISSGSPTDLAANGGKDKIKSGSPDSKEQKMMGEDKAKKAEDKEEDEKKEKESKEKEEKEKMKKAEEKDEDEKEEKKEEDKEAKKAYPKPSKMKKSIEELSAHLDEDELELIKAWREEESSEEVAKSETAAKEQKEETQEESLAKSLSKAFEEQIAPLKKAMEDKDALIKSMSDKIEKLASQPAYDRRSISTLETLEKSGSEGTQELSKSQITEKMLGLQLAGKGVTSHHIAEFEATGNISDANVKAIVFKELKLS